MSKNKSLEFVLARKRRQLKKQINKLIYSRKDKDKFDAKDEIRRLESDIADIELKLGK